MDTITDRRAARPGGFFSRETTRAHPDGETVWTQERLRIAEAVRALPIKGNWAYADGEVMKARPLIDRAVVLAILEGIESTPHHGSE